MDVARAWARGSPRDESQDDLAAFGAPAELLDNVQPKDVELIVFEENWEAVELFHKLSTQWVWGSAGGAFGLNYQSLDLLFKLYKTRKRQAVFEQLQIMELAALQVLNERES